MYDRGDRITVTVECKDGNGNLANPSSIKLLVKPPRASIVTYNSPVNPATGKFEQAVILNAPGLWRWRWEAVGSTTQAERGEAAVRNDVFVGA